MAKKSLKWGIIGILAVLAVFGGSEYLNKDQLGETYVCPLTNEIGIFTRRSASGKTGYYTDENGVELKFPCRIGRVYEPWIAIEEYAELIGISVEDLIEPKVEEIINQTIIEQPVIEQTIINNTYINLTVINQTVWNETTVVVIEDETADSYNEYYITNQTVINQVLLNRSDFEVPQPIPSPGKRWLCSPTGCMRIE